MPGRECGFILNTLFYTAIWLTIFFGTSAARCAIRRMRRQCVMCGYDLRGMLDSGCQSAAGGGIETVPESHTTSVMALVCPACEYDLRGSVTLHACPECGIDVRSLQFTLRGIQIRASRRRWSILRNACIWTAIILLLLQKWVIGPAALGVAALFEIRRRRETDPISVLGVAEGGLVISQDRGRVTRFSWAEVHRPEMAPARNETAKRLYERLGRLARPWSIRAGELRFGVLAPKEDADAIIARVIELWEPVAEG